jgi:hypothetical protein
MSIPIEPASRPRRGFAGAIYLIGGCAMILSAYSMNNLATVFIVLLGACSILEGIRYLSRDRKNASPAVSNKAIPKVAK